MRTVKLSMVKWEEDPNQIIIATNPKEGLQTIVYQIIGTPKFFRPIRVRAGIWSTFKDPMAEADIDEGGIPLKIYTEFVKELPEMTIAFVSLPMEFHFPVVVEVQSKEQFFNRTMLILAKGTPPFSSRT